MVDNSTTIIKSSYHLHVHVSPQVIDTTTKTPQHMRSFRNPGIYRTIHMTKFHLTFFHHLAYHYQLIQCYALNILIFSETPGAFYTTNSVGYDLFIINVYCIEFM